jgi:hypothetical protein
MKTALPLCLLLACGAASSDVALAAHHHRPNAAAAARPGPASDDTAKSAVTPVEPTGAPSHAASGNAGDAPIDTSITVNQGHRILTGKEAAAKRLSTELEKLNARIQVKPHLPAHPFAAHVAPVRNALGAAVVHPSSPAGNRAAVATGASAPAKPGAQPGAAAGGASTVPTPAPHDVIGTATLTPKTPAAAERGAAVLKTVTANGPSVNGTGVAKSSAATAAVGGPTKTVTAAAVGGSSFRPKHP